MNETGLDMISMTTFFGWCTVINVGIMTFAFTMLIVMGDWVVKLRAKLFGIEEASVRIAHFQLFLAYAILMAVFNLVPYIALKIMG